jgi:hypothetical protein
MDFKSPNGLGTEAAAWEGSPQGSSKLEEALVLKPQGLKARLGAGVEGIT